MKNNIILIISLILLMGCVKKEINTCNTSQKIENSFEEYQKKNYKKFKHVKIKKNKKKKNIINPKFR